MSQLSFETFVSLRCAIERGATRARVLEQAGVSELQWTALQRRWLRAMAREAERGGGDLTRQYVQGFSVVVEPAAEPAPAPVLAPPLEAPLPVAPRPVAPVPVAPAVVPAAAQRPMTMGMQVVPLMQPAPFAPDHDKAAPAPVADEVAREAADMIGETGFVGALVVDGTLPFGKSAPAVPNIDETAFMSALVFDDTDALPFGGDKAEAPAPVGHEVALEAAALVGETSFVHPALRDETLTLEQYASLRADLDRAAPEQRASVLAKYTVADEDQFVELKRTWADRFREDPSSYGVFRAAYDAYSQWLSAQ